MILATRRSGLWVAAGAVLPLLCAVYASAEHTFTGPSKCTGCHDHERQASKWQREEPAAFGGKSHFAALKLLDNPKSGGWAKAIGLPDPYDVKGSCVRCHGTVFRGDANAGVSCESCHGAASGYLDVHQEKGAYAKAVAAGLRDLRQKTAAIARVCVDCHITTDRKLLAAGHPVGEKFDAGVSLQKIVHWATAYDFARVGADGRALTGGRAAKGPEPAASSAAAAAKPATGALAASEPAAAGTARGAPAPAAAAPRPPTATKPAAPAPPVEAAPWDWDQPVRPLPPEYVPEGAPEPARPVAPAATKPAGGAPAPGRPRPVALPRPPQREPTVPPSLAEERTPIAVPAVAPSATLVPAVRRPPAAQAAEVRGRAVAVLDRLLRSGARTPNLPPPEQPAEFRGPDSELLRLQDEILALALEALRRPEAPPAEEKK